MNFMDIKCLDSGHSDAFLMTNLNYLNSKDECKFVISSRDDTGEIINSIELNRKDHWMVGVQFHPEFKSRPYAASPCYTAFIKACIILGYRYHRLSEHQCE